MYDVFKSFDLKTVYLINQLKSLPLCSHSYVLQLLWIIKRHKISVFDSYYTILSAVKQLMCDSFYSY